MTYLANTVIAQIDSGTQPLAALARAPVVRVVSFEGITHWYLLDGSRVWKAHSKPIYHACPPRLS